jgi:cytoskeletal protein RodZ
MMDGLKKIGTFFRAKREEMNLTLKEVENATSIRMTYLQAIEEGRVQQFLSTVYALGFIRQYAGFLGFDAEKIGKDYPDVFRMPVEKQEFDYGIGTLEARGSPQGGVRWMPNLAWSVGVIVLGIGAWYFGKLVGAF